MQDRSFAQDRAPSARRANPRIIRTAAATIEGRGEEGRQMDSIDAESELYGRGRESDFMNTTPFHFWSDVCYNRERYRILAEAFSERWPSFHPFCTAVPTWSQNTGSWTRKQDLF